MELKSKQKIHLKYAHGKNSLKSPKTCQLDDVILSLGHELYSQDFLTKDKFFTSFLMTTLMWRKRWYRSATIRMDWQWIDKKKEEKMCVEDLKSKFIPNIKEGTLMTKGDKLLNVQRQMGGHFWSNRFSVKISFHLYH